MIKLTVTAIDRSIILQDPRPVTQHNGEQAVISVTAGTSKSVDMQWSQLERLSAQLIGLSSIGACSFTIENADSPGFVAQADAPSNPIIDLFTGSVEPDGITGGIITGVNLLSGQSRVGLQINGDAGTGILMLTALTPGNPATEIQVEIVNVGGTLAASYAASKLTIDLGGSARTLSAIVAEINGEATITGILVAKAYGDDSDTIATTATMSATNLTPFADLKIASDGTGLLVLLASTSGFPTLDLEVEIIDSSSGGLSVSHTDTLLTIDLGGTTPAISALITAINADIGNILTATSDVNATDSIIDTLVATELNGGSGGTGWILTVGGLPATITAVDVDIPTAETITFNVGTTNSYTADDNAMIMLRSNEKVTSITTIIATAT